MDTLFFVAIFTFASVRMRTIYDKKKLPWNKRWFGGLSLGAIFGLLATVSGMYIRESNESGPMEAKEWALYFALFLFLGIVSVFKQPKDDAESLRELLDDPEKITPKQRVEAAKAKHRKQQLETHYK